MVWLSSLWLKIGVFGFPTVPAASSTAIPDLETNSRVSVYTVVLGKIVVSAVPSFEF